MVSAVAQLGKAEEEVDALHAQLEARGVNSRGTQDVFGRKFAVPVGNRFVANFFLSSQESLAAPVCRFALLV